MRAQLGDADLNLGALGIAADNARSIGVIYLSHPDGAMLEEFAAAAIVVLSQRNQGYFPQLGGEAAQVTILEAPTVAAVPPPIVDRFAPLLRIAVGFVIGFALLLLAEYFRSQHSRSARPKQARDTRHREHSEDTRQSARVSFAVTDASNR